MDMEELKILAIDDMIEVIGEVHQAVNRELTNLVSKYSKGRVLYGSSVMHLSTINTLRLIQKQLLEQMANKSHMA